MWQRNREVGSPFVVVPPSPVSRSRRPKFGRRPRFDTLEGRQLLTASLQSISDVISPLRQGYVVPLNGSGTSDPQTFTVTSSNPDIAATVAHGQYLTINVQYTDPSNPANSFSGPLTFQLFQDLTPNTAARIEQFAASGGYNGTQFFRIVSNFSGSGGPADVVIQGGPQGAPGNGTSPIEAVQPLAFVQPGSIAIANAGPNTEGQEFFVTTGPQPFLDYNYTIFGQLVAGASTLAKVAQVPVHVGPFGENSAPNNPVVLSTATLSTTNPNGAVVVDTTRAKAGETARITVTATDPLDRTTLTRTFTASVGAYTGPNDPSITFRPLAAPVTSSASAGTGRTVTLAGQSTYPDASQPGTLTYALVSQPTHGTISRFDASAGTFVYTPNPGFSGTDTFRYVVQVTGPSGTLASSPAAVNVTVTAPSAVVRLQRTGTGVQPTHIVLTFNGPMDPSGVQDRGNYLLFPVGPSGRPRPFARPVPVLSAVYDPVQHTVTLTTGLRLNPNGYYLLSVNGAGGAGAVRGVGGPLVGTNPGGKTGGSNYIAVVHGYAPLLS